MSQAPLANRLADYANQLRFEDLPPAVVHEVKRRFIDSIATAVGAMPADAYAIAKRCALRVQGNPGATLFGGGRSSAEWATFVNGLLIRYLDYNDTYLSLEPAHPSDNIAPVLAVGDMLGSGGKDLITATVLAYELQCRFCDASSLRQQGVDHVTYGAISSAVAACKLLGLDAVQTAHAIGLAGVCNVALRQTRAGELSMWKGCAFANAARNGVFAALLAAEGLTGPAPIFEGEVGFFKLVSRETWEPAPMGSAANKHFMITDTYIKFWPAEYHSQSAIDAALQLRAQLNPPLPPLTGGAHQEWAGDLVKAVARLDIHTFNAAVDIIGKDPEKWRPRTRETADHSLPYCTAVALLDGQVTEAQFEPSRFTDPQLLELVSKIQVHRDADLNPHYPRGIPNRLTLTLTDGRQRVKEVEFPRGHARNPMSDAEVEQKFRSLVEPRYGKDRADQILAVCWKLETLKAAGDLIRLVD
jgi:2-methylcitrate dehydratase